MLAACVAVAVPQLFLMNTLRRRETTAAVVLNRRCADGACRAPEAMVPRSMRLRPLVRHLHVVAVVLTCHVRAALRRARTLSGARRGATACIRRIKQLCERAGGGRDEQKIHMAQGGVQAWHAVSRGRREARVVAYAASVVAVRFELPGGGGN